MLKATQSQLETAQETQAALETSGEHAARAVAGLREATSEAEQLTSETLEQFETRIEQIAAEQVRQFEQQIAARLEEALRVEQRLTDTLRQAERLAAMVESAEVNITVLAHRAAETARKADERAMDAAAAAKHCDETRGMLAQDLIDADQRIEEQAARADEIRRRASRSLSSCEQSIARLDKRISQAKELPATQADSVPAEIAGDRPDVVERQASQQATGDMKATPEVIDAMLLQIKDAIVTDMSRISTAISQIAERVDQPPTPQIGSKQPSSTDVDAASSAT